MLLPLEVAAIPRKSIRAEEKKSKLARLFKREIIPFHFYIFLVLFLF
jgi:hypothetical protein